MIELRLIPATKVKNILQKIDKAIEDIEADERYNYPPAQVQINAPLALIQVELDTKAQTLKWVKGLIQSEFTEGELQ